MTITVLEGKVPQKTIRRCGIGKLKTLGPERSEVKASGEDDKTRRTKRLRASSAKEELPLARSETPTTPRLSGGRVHELATLYLAEQDLEVRFQVRAIRGKGKVERGLDLLAKAQGKSSPDSR